MRGPRSLEHDAERRLMASIIRAARTQAKNEGITVDEIFDRALERHQRRQHEDENDSHGKVCRFDASRRKKNPLQKAP